MKAIVMTHRHAKSQDQRSLGSVETDRQMDGGNCIISHANIVGNYTACERAVSLIYRPTNKVLVSVSRQTSQCKISKPRPDSMVHQLDFILNNVEMYI